VGNDARTYWDLSRTFRAGATPLAFLLLNFIPLFAQEQLLPLQRIQRLEGYKSGWVAVSNDFREIKYGRHVDFVLPTGYHIRCTLMMASLMAVDPMTESSINPSHDFTAFIGHRQSA
jgi:hypothetical protein